MLDTLSNNPELFKEMLIELLSESYLLAEEPEFIDLYLDPEQTYAIAIQTLEEYEDRLEAAEKKGLEQLEYLRDDMRAEAIKRLLDDRVRKDILYRLDSLVERIKTSKDEADSEKLLIATALLSAFDIPNFPWGMSPLLAEIYQRSLNFALENNEEAQLLDDIRSVLGEDLSPQDVLEKATDPAFIRKIENTIDPDSELYERISVQADKLTQDFYEAIENGKIALDVYTGDEIMKCLTKLEERIIAEQIDPEDFDQDRAAEIMVSVMDESLAEIVTPERLHQIKTELGKLVEKWFREGNKYAGALRLEVEYLDEEEPASDSFARILFLSQLQRAMQTLAS